MPKKAAAKKGPVRTTGYRVESESYPSGMGCYAAQDLSDDYIEACTTIKIVGEYDTMEEAKETAIQERDYTCQFEGWAEEYYGDKDPPFFSSDEENYDEEENVHIYVVDIAKEAARTAKENVNKQKAIENARNSKRPAKKKTKTTSFGPTKRKLQTRYGNLFYATLLESLAANRTCLPTMAFVELESLPLFT